MIAACKTGKIDLIVTKSISRFARNTIDCLKYIRDLKAINVAIFFEKEYIKNRWKPINSMDFGGFLYDLSLICRLNLQRDIKEYWKIINDSIVTYSPLTHMHQFTTLNT